MKILILGGTGVLSYDFTRKCIAENDDVWLVNRNLRHVFSEQNAHNLKADIRNIGNADWDNMLGTEEYDVVVDFLSFNPSQIKMHVEALKNRVGRYVFISSAVAYKKIDDSLISEERNAVGNDKCDYGYQKALCERYLIGEGIEYTIVRPYVTFGRTRIPFQLIPGRYNYTLLARIIGGKPVALVNGGEAVCTLTDTRDFANILHGLLLSDKAAREDYHITSGSEFKWCDIYRILCELLKAKENPFDVSLDDVKNYMPNSYDMLRGDKATDWKFDNSKALEAIGGYTFKYDIYDSLSESVDHFTNNQTMQGIDFLWEAEIDRMLNKLGCADNLKCLPGNQFSKRRYLYSIARSDVGNKGLHFVRKLKEKKS